MKVNLQFTMGEAQAVMSEHLTQVLADANVITPSLLSGAVAVTIVPVCPQGPLPLSLPEEGIEAILNDVRPDNRILQIKTLHTLLYDSGFSCGLGFAKRWVELAEDAKKFRNKPLIAPLG